VRAANELKRGFLSHQQECAVWLSHDLENIKEAVKSVGSQGPTGRSDLTKSQVVALEKVKVEKETHGEFESECPGYCVACIYYDRQINS
jgi:hypothetical protein